VARAARERWIEHARSSDLPAPVAAGEGEREWTRGADAESRGDLPAAGSAFSAAAQRFDEAVRSSREALLADARRAEREAVSAREAVERSLAESPPPGPLSMDSVRWRAALREGAVSDAALAELDADLAAGRAALGREAAPEARTRYRAATARAQSLSAAVARLRAEAAGAVARDAQGRTGLHAAASKGDEAAVARLLGWGAPADARDDEDVQPVHLVAWAGSVPALRRLLDAGAPVDAVAKVAPVGAGVPDRPRFEDATPLMMAAYGGHAPAVQLLLDRGADTAKRGRNLVTRDYG
jgi:hypothetical protein